MVTIGTIDKKCIYMKFEREYYIEKLISGKPFSTERSEWRNLRIEPRYGYTRLALLARYDN